MSSKTVSKTGKKKPAAKKDSATGRTVTRADVEKLRGQISELTAAVEKLAEAVSITAAAGVAGREETASTARRLRTTARALGCLDLLTASQIVQDAAGGPHNIDSKLRDIGFISDDQRRVFQEDVFEGVLDAGCDINRGDIPNGADNTLREVRTAIRAAAH